MFNALKCIGILIGSIIVAYAAISYLSRDMDMKLDPDRGYFFTYKKKEK